MGFQSDLRAGRTHLALARLAQVGHLTCGADRDRVLAALIARWSELRDRGDDVLAMAHRRADVDELNRPAQAVRADRGELGDDPVGVPGVTIHVGDEVIITRPHRPGGGA